MCTSYTLRHTVQEIAVRFRVEAVVGELPMRDRNAPTELIAVVTENSPRTLEPMRWGLIPSWAKDLFIGQKMLNARSETIAEKPAFRTAFSKRRCIIPADGFYEWHTEGKKKDRYYIKLTTNALFAFAGLWEEWIDQKGEPLRSCTIVTCAPNPLMAAIHNRMPAILSREDEDTWLNKESNHDEDLLKLLKPYSEDEMEAYLDPKLGHDSRSNQISLTLD